MNTFERPVVQRMMLLTQQWEAAQDRRAIFLGCYTLMTRNMLDAIDAGRFHDGGWVSRLLHRFADYYFEALAAYEQQPAAAPPVWQLAHDMARREHVMTIQHLLLGVNAHINFDLIFSLADLLEPEWDQLDEDAREKRHADHTQVNLIIGETIDRVQDAILEPRSPWLDIFDRLLGPVDEWLTSRLIAGWREAVWREAVRLIALREAADRAAFRHQTEANALRRSYEILGEFAR
jgi:hypothetical protein